MTYGTDMVGNKIVTQTLCTALVLVATLCALVALNGCGENDALYGIDREPTETSKPEAVDHDHEINVSGTELREVFTAENDRLLSPVIELSDGAEQVGLMLTMTLEAAPVGVWVRGVDGEAHGAWQNAEWTFHEEDRLAGFGALDGVYLGVQVSVPSSEADIIDSLTFAPALLADPSEDTEIVMDEAAQNESGLVGELAYVGVLPRSAWGARNHRCSTQEAGNNYDRVALHHGGSKAWSSPEGYLRQAQAYHMDGRNYCDIAYHFGISVDGRTFELRPQPYRGGHTRHNNTRNIGVLFAGCFHPTCGNDVPTPALQDAGAGLLAMFNLLHNIPINADKVRGHRDHSYASTACPGDGLYAQLQSIRDQANAKLAALAGNTPEPEAQPDPEPPVVTPPANCGGLASGQALSRGTSVTSCDGRFVFAHQTDGNVVLYKNGTALWASWTNGSGSTTQSLVMQGDGNLVLYTAGGAALWHTHTYGHGGARLAVQDDGNVVIYSSNNVPLWHTATHGH